MTPIRASKQSNEKEIFCNLHGRRNRHDRKLKLGQLVRKADIRKLFSNGDITNYS